MTERVSVTTGGAEGNNRSWISSISADGRYVSFQSDATNMVSGDTDGKADIFVYDRQEGTVTRVNVTAGGIQADGYSYASFISGNGRFVASSARQPRSGIPQASARPSSRIW